MKVLMISEYFQPISKGGGEISAFMLAKELSKSGIKVHVLTSYFSGLKKNEVTEGVIIHRYLRTGKNTYSFIDNISRVLFFEKSLLKELRGLQKKENFDIIHCMNTTSISAVGLKKEIKKPFILHVNGPTLFCPKATLMYKDKELCSRDCIVNTYLECMLSSKFIGKSELKPLIKYNPLALLAIRKRYGSYQGLLSLFDYYIPISTFMQNRLVMAGVSARRTEVVYNIMEFKETANHKKRTGEIKRILYLGEYSSSKGVMLLADALNMIKIPFKASFYGEGPLKEGLKKAARSLDVKIYDKVEYSHVPGILGEHDIVVFPSFVAEAFGRSALEGLIAGKYVIAANIGGVSDFIDDKNMLFEPGNIQELKEKIELALRSDYNSNNNMKKLSKKFSKKLQLKKIIKIYEKVAKDYK